MSCPTADLEQDFPEQVMRMIRRRLPDKAEVRGRRIFFRVPDDVVCFYAVAIQCDGMLLLGCYDSASTMMREVKKFSSLLSRTRETARSVPSLRESILQMVLAAVGIASGMAMVMAGGRLAGGSVAAMWTVCGLINLPRLRDAWRRRKAA